MGKIWNNNKASKNVIYLLTINVYPPHYGQQTWLKQKLVGNKNTDGVGLMLNYLTVYLSPNYISRNSYMVEKILFIK